MKLITKRLILRDIKKSDGDSIRKNINNINVSRYLLTVAHPYTKKDAEWWVNHCIEQQNKKPRTNYELGIAIKPNKEIIGGIGLSKIDEFQGTAEIGYWIGEGYWRKGYMAEAAEKIIGFAFNKLKLRKLNILVFAKNIASNALAKKLTGKLEGTLKKNCRAKSTGKLHDENIYGLFKDGWEKARKRLK
jgi:RimJ/RimL family protein N-acetyltransferase